MDSMTVLRHRVTFSRVYLTHFERDYAAMNAVYQSYFAPGRLPARTCIGVTALARGALVEIVSWHTARAMRATGSARRAGDHRPSDATAIQGAQVSEGLARRGTRRRYTR